jgi:DNA-directed RNA polymerase beta subunit
MSQKATIGKIYDVGEMPYIVGGPDDGVSPDFIISPISLPSRMTVSLLYEILISQASAQLGQLYNATGFRNRDIPSMEELLKLVGFTPKGKVNMIDGSTGKLLAREVAVGYVNYQMLKHNVKDKIQSRSKGSVDPMHRQPIGGRAQGGALRVGEMERDSFISHGASAILVDRLCTVSDAVKVPFCTVCGTIAIANFLTKELTCRYYPQLHPTKKPKFSSNTIPYVYKYLTQLMWGACIFMQLKS